MIELKSVNFLLTSLKSLVNRQVLFAASYTSNTNSSPFCLVSAVILLSYSTFNKYYLPNCLLQH